MFVSLAGIAKQSLKRVAKLSRFTLCKPEPHVEELWLLAVSSILMR
jgi:hypothetical protein